MSYKDFQSHVINNYGELKWEQVNEHLESFKWRLLHAKYHKDESQHLFETTISNKEIPPIVEAVGNILELASGTGKSQEIALAIIKSEAHLIAYAQALDSSCDILAKVIYYGIDLNNHIKPIDPRHINLSQIKENLHNASYKLNLESVINDLIDSNEYKYLHGFVNQTKHHSLIHSKQYVSFEEMKYGLKISEFSFGSNMWDKKLANDFITDDYSIILQLLDNIILEIAR